MSKLNQAAQVEDSDQVPQCCCCDTRTGLSILVALQVLGFVFAVYEAITWNVPVIILSTYGFDILLIISGIIGLALQRSKWILTYGILSLIGLILEVCVVIYRQFFAPSKSAPYERSHAFPEHSGWLAFALGVLLNVWILVVTFRYYKFLRNRESSQKGQV
jgi:hypothetical protein